MRIQKKIRIFQIRLLPLSPNNEEPLNNEELLKSLKDKDLEDRFKKLEVQLEDLEPLIKISRCIDSFIKKFSNDTQENSKDPQKKEEALKGVKEENIKLKEENTALTIDKENLTKVNAELKKENDKLNHQVIALTKEQDSLKYERAQLQDVHGFLEELCASLEKDNQHLTDKLKKLESAQKIKAQ
ncbi:hypothetical protein [Helicobacter pylori]|uniref:hypothetical protein n=1 Tax=Helicobacter pylori TaxID=210 RepID=UPI0039C6D033